MGLHDAVRRCGFRNVELHDAVRLCGFGNVELHDAVRLCGFRNMELHDAVRGCGFRSVDLDRCASVHPPADHAERIRSKQRAKKHPECEGCSDSHCAP